MMSVCVPAGVGDTASVPRILVADSSVSPSLSEQTSEIVVTRTQKLIV